MKRISEVHAYLSLSVVNRSGLFMEYTTQMYEQGTNWGKQLRYMYPLNGQTVNTQILLFPHPHTVAARNSPWGLTGFRR